MVSDSELLQRYVKEGAEDAFTALVSRHFKVVYQAARRQVGGDAHKAEDVAQVVFSELARQAPALCGRPVLLSWLYTTTHFAAAKLRRGDRRREQRENEDYLMRSATNDSTSVSVDRDLAAVLDTAMQELPEKDREAVLLRFFQGCSFREVGAMLRVSEEAARKRVSRALADLERVLSRRGVVSTAAALAIALETQAAQPVPTAALAAIARAALRDGAAHAAVAGGSAAAAGGALVVFMKAKSIVATALLLAAAAGLYYQHAQVQDLRAALASAQAESKRVGQLLSDERRAISGERFSAPAAVPPIATPAGAAADPAIIAALDAWFAKIDRLTAYLKANPQMRIPQMDALTGNDWLDVAKNYAFEAEADYRQALGDLRGKARSKFSDQIGKAVVAAIAASGGQAPDDPLALAPYLPPGFNLDILRQLQRNPSGRVPGLTAMGVDKQPQYPYIDARVDLWDGLVYYGQGGVVTSPNVPGQQAVRKAIADYTTATGAPPTQAAQLKAYPNLEKIEPAALDALFAALTTRPSL